MTEAHHFEAEIWASASVGSWAFVTVPRDVGDEIRMLSGPPTAFGSVRVEVTVGGSRWRTSVFPDRLKGYVLPLKQAVRRAEDLEVGEVVRVCLRLIDQH